MPSSFMLSFGRFKFFLPRRRHRNVPPSGQPVTHPGDTIPTLKSPKPQDIQNPSPPTSITVTLPLKVPNPGPEPAASAHPLRLPPTCTNTALLTRLDPSVLDRRLSATPIFHPADDRSTLPSQRRLRIILRQEREHHFLRTAGDYSDDGDTDTETEWEICEFGPYSTAATTPASCKAQVAGESALHQAPGPAGPFLDAPPLNRAPALRRKRSRSWLGGADGETGTV